MSSGRGISSLTSKDLSEKYQKLGSSVLQSQKEHLLTQLQVFQAALIQFKNEYSSEIVQNQEVRTNFSEICIAFGIDPLVVASSIIGEKNSSTERTNQLCLKIIEICTQTRSINGGIISMQDLLDLINSDTWVNQDLHLAFQIKDITTALNHLKILGDELQIVTLGKKDYIKSIPQEISSDQQKILETSDIMGYVTITILKDNFKWKRIRCQSAIDELVSNGILWLDKQNGHAIKYWTTTWINK
ncbi:hypothetical protein C6P40_004805 [Pichia californica]|uniref:Vacuolar-sorting protein SNF8 n=1 Tax=Pichia californica TaxID=460514 RepID=A0A9P7BH57_9ASCO|nr:hypothetical protein C6P42_004231 [[Candida] californica]KAG0689599.1 hypothetical protein C6P40_004805 [[Candida] californica]